MLAMSRLAYPIDDFATEVGVSRAHLYKIIKRGDGPRVTKIGKKSVVRAEDARAWLNALATKATAA